MWLGGEAIVIAFYAKCCSTFFAERRRNIFEQRCVDYMVIGTVFENLKPVKWLPHTSDLSSTWFAPYVMRSKRGADVPMPYATNLETAAVPQVQNIVTAVKNTLNRQL